MRAARLLACIAVLSSACASAAREPSAGEDTPPPASTTPAPTPGPSAADAGASLAAPFTRDEVLAVLARVNDHFMAEWPSPGADIVVGKPVASNTWTRAVYFEGLSALMGVSHDPRLLAYANGWGESHAWQLSGPSGTRLADDQCAGQTYLELSAIEPSVVDLSPLEANVMAMVNSDTSEDWTWIDAIQMAMPVFARLGTLRGDARITEKMHALYTYTRDTAGGHGLFDQGAGLWWRDAHFAPPYAEPNGKGCYWSRGNGWVYAGLARVLDVLPESDPHRHEYVADFIAMSAAIREVRREDGFWNVSLQDPTHFGGKELTGTSLFVYGMAWGIAAGLLPEDVYAPIVTSSFDAMMKTAVHPDGMLGYVQGTATQPADSQPTGYDVRPNYDDFGVGCFLLAGAEVAKLVAPHGALGTRAFAARSPSSGIARRGVSP